MSDTRNCAKHRWAHPRDECPTCALEALEAKHLAVCSDLAELRHEIAAGKGTFFLDWLTDMIEEVDSRFGVHHTCLASILTVLNDPTDEVQDEADLRSRLIKELTERGRETQIPPAERLE